MDSFILQVYPGEESNFLKQSRIGCMTEGKEKGWLNYVKSSCELLLSGCAHCACHAHMIYIRSE